jgi:N-acetylmuramoyl-L-alanine amidase
MTEFSGHGRPSISPFAGLSPTRTGAVDADGLRRVAAGEPARTSRTLMATMPIILVGTLAISTTLGLAPSTHSTKPEQRPRANASDPEVAAATITPASNPVGPSASGEIDIASVAPATYAVQRGDTVSGIAGRFGLSTASVLAVNGLGWKTLIFPGQVLKLRAATPTAAAPSAPVVTAPTVNPASAVTGSYVIRSGDTITAIARRFGVSVAAILSANNLVSSSIIYTGHTLVIPGAATVAPAGVQPASVQPTGTQPVLVSNVTVPLTSSERANAQTIIAVGRSLRVPDYGIVVALAAAAQESGLQNLNYGDRDSVGLFQQRPSAGWGTIALLTTPSYAAELFYGGPSNPNKGRTRGLLDISGWQSMTVTQAAQAVQISGSPNAYAKWEASARAWLAQLG